MNNFYQVLGAAIAVGGVVASCMVWLDHKFAQVFRKIDKHSEKNGETFREHDNRIRALETRHVRSR